MYIIIWSFQLTSYDRDYNCRRCPIKSVALCNQHWSSPSLYTSYFFIWKICIINLSSSDFSFHRFSSHMNTQSPCPVESKMYPAQFSCAGIIHNFDPHLSTTPQDQGNNQATVSDLSHERIAPLWFSQSCPHCVIPYSYGAVTGQEYHYTCRWSSHLQVAILHFY